jgi:hypothetical protein
LLLFLRFKDRKPLRLNNLSVLDNIDSYITTNDNSLIGIDYFVYLLHELLFMKIKCWHVKCHKVFEVHSYVNMSIKTKQHQVILFLVRALKMDIATRCFKRLVNSNIHSTSPTIINYITYTERYKKNRK